MPSASSFTFDIPTLETERLRLRAQTLDDFPASCALWANEAVTRYTVGKPLSAEETWARMLRNLGHWAMSGFGNWCVEQRDTGEFVGEVGIFDFRRELEPPVQQVPELGWVLAPHAHGNGYATEAVQAVLRWTSQRGLDSEGVTALIQPENGASIRVARKCGFQESNLAVYRGRPFLVFVRPA